MLKRLILAIFLIIGIYESNTMEKILPEMPSDLEIINVDGYRIYTAEIRLESGEIAYFAMEPIINKDRADKWQDYANLTKDLTTQRSYLYSVFMNTKNLMTEISSAFPNTTEHKQEVLELITNLIKTKNPKNIAESISGIYSGCQGMHYSINDYITYISKTPVTGFFLLPDQAPEEKDFDAYINAYDNLIMSVSSFHDLEKNTYQHRGIFRNPISMIRRDYQGLGILIHAFTGLAWSVKSPNVKYMIVNPDGNYYMRSLLEKIFNEEEKGFTLEDARDLPNSYIIVKIDALKSRFPLFQ